MQKLNFFERVIFLSLMILLSACVSAQTSQYLSQTKADYLRCLEQSKPTFSFEIINKRKIAKDDLEDAEEEMRTKVSKTCAKDFDDNLKDQISLATKEAKGGDSSRLNKLPKYADSLQGTFRSCLKKLGLKGKYYVVTYDGQEISVSEWLKELSAKGKAYALADNQADLERSESAKTVGKAVVVAAAVTAVAVAASRSQGGGGGGYQQPLLCSQVGGSPQCGIGKACGNSCIAENYTCYIGRGTACNLYPRNYP